MSLPETLRAELRRRRLSPSSLAAATGCTPTTMAQYLDGSAHPDLYRLALMANALRLRRSERREFYLAAGEATFGQRLDEHLRRAGFTAGALAERMRMSVSTLNSLREDRNVPRRSTLEQLVDAFDLGGEERSRLYHAAGMMPEAVPSVSTRETAVGLANRMLGTSACPAYLADSWGYVQAWNRAFGRLWHPAALEERLAAGACTVFDLYLHPACRLPLAEAQVQVRRLAAFWNLRRDSLDPRRREVLLARLAQIPGFLETVAGTPAGEPGPGYTLELDHPRWGRLRVRVVSLCFPAANDWDLITFLAADAAARLAYLEEGICLNEG
ncbi:MAG: helix-turn-helix domain-containing protein [Thermaerobacter sp.]|nr:helix-turn-helix domain-containing protein [Thermaerobacter sp.]